MAIARTTRHDDSPCAGGAAACALMEARRTEWQGWQGAALFPLE